MSKTKLSKNWLYLLSLVLFILIYYLSPRDSTVATPITPPAVTEETTSSLVPDEVSWYEIYFTSPQIPFDHVTTGGIEDFLIEKINMATTTIDLAVYEFSLENVAQALISAQNRGVVVRVVYDNEFADPDPQIKEVQTAGISTIPDKRSAFMHNKFFIFDHQCLWTGSFNISQNAAYRNNENALYFCSAEAAENYTTEFEELFSGQFGVTSPSNTPHPSFVVAGHTVENYFAPEDQVMDQIISEVLDAQKFVHFMAFSFTDDQLGQAMISEIHRGVSVDGIFESRGANTQYSECLPLRQNSASITLDGNPRTFHHKVIIIDSEVVILGSFNFTAAANQTNDENLLIVHDTALATDYEAEFQRMKLLSVAPADNTCQSQ
jgi:phosphatidylserine/phosphatidylglycerophosphate/cardiolipin synthase-like enzyme